MDTPGGVYLRNFVDTFKVLVVISLSFAGAEAKSQGKQERVRLGVCPSG